MERKATYKIPLAISHSVHRFHLLIVKITDIVTTIVLTKYS